MAVRTTREQVIQLGRFIFFVEGTSLLAALLLGATHAAITRSRFVDSFTLMAFVIFLLFLGFAALSGPGFFLARPRFSPISEEGRARWRRWLAAPPLGGDREFYDLVLYTGIGFLLLAIATGIGALVQWIGG